MSSKRSSDDSDDSSSSSGEEEEIKVPQDSWVACDRCSKWRRIPTALAASLTDDTPWYCEHNPNKALNSCDVPQELTNEQIDAINEEGDAEEDVEDAHLWEERARRRRIPAVWQLIRDNVMTHRRRKVQEEDDVMICNCKPHWRGGDGCGPDCINRMLCVECAAGFCPSEDRCTNQVFTKKQYARLEVRRAGAKGFGLFALEPIVAGQFIIEYIGEVLEEEEYLRRKEFYAEVGQRHYYFMNIGNGEVIDACRKGNRARFINHSCDPNCETQKWLARGELAIGLFATKDIGVGEELTFDYNFERYGDKPMRCYCASRTCRKFIGGTQDTYDENMIVIDPEDVSNDFQPVMLIDSDMDWAAKALLDWRVGVMWDKDKETAVLGKLERVCKVRGVPWTPAHFNGTAAMPRADSSEALVEPESNGAATGGAAVEGGRPARAKPPTRKPSGAVLAGKEMTAAERRKAANKAIKGEADAGVKTEDEEGGVGFKGPLKAAYKLKAKEKEQLDKTDTGSPKAADSKPIPGAVPHKNALFAAVKGSAAPRKRGSAPSRTDASHASSATGAAGGQRSRGGAVTSASERGEGGAVTSSQMSAMTDLKDSVLGKAEVPIKEEVHTIKEEPGLGGLLSREREAQSRGELEPPQPVSRGRKGWSLSVGPRVKRRSEIDRRLDQLVGPSGRMKDASRLNIIKVLRMFNLCDFGPPRATQRPVVLRSDSPVPDPTDPSGQGTISADHAPGLPPRGSSVPPTTTQPGSDADALSAVNPTPQPPQQTQTPPDTAPGDAADGTTFQQQSVTASTPGEAQLQQPQQQQIPTQTGAIGPPQQPATTASDPAVAAVVATGGLRVPSPSIAGTTAPHIPAVIQQPTARLAGGATHPQGPVVVTGRQRARMADLSLLLDVILKTSSATIRKDFVTCGVLNQLQQVMGRNLGSQFSVILRKILRVMEALPLTADDIYSVRTAHGTLADTLQELSSNSDFEIRNKASGLLKRYPPSACEDQGLVQRPAGRRVPTGFSPAIPQPEGGAADAAVAGAGLPPMQHRLGRIVRGGMARGTSSADLHGGVGVGASMPASPGLGHGPDSPRTDGDGADAGAEDPQPKRRRRFGFSDGPLLQPQPQPADGPDRGPNRPLPYSFRHGSALLDHARGGGPPPPPLDAEDLFELLLVPDVVVQRAPGYVDPVPPVRARSPPPHLPHGEPSDMEVIFAVGAYDTDWEAAAHAAARSTLSVRTKRGMGGGGDTSPMAGMAPLSPVGFSVTSSPVRLEFEDMERVAEEEAAAAAAAEQARLAAQRRQQMMGMAGMGGMGGGAPGQMPLVMDLRAGAGPGRGMAVLTPPNGGLRTASPSVMTGGMPEIEHLQGHGGVPVASLHAGGRPRGLFPPESPLVLANARRSPMVGVQGRAGPQGPGMPPPGMSHLGMGVQGYAGGTPQGPGQTMSAVDLDAAEWARPMGTDYPESWDEPDQSFDQFVSETVRYRLGKYVTQPDHPNRISSEDAHALFGKIHREVVDKERSAFEGRRAQGLFKLIEKRKVEHNLKEFVRLSIRRFHTQQAGGGAGA